MQTDFFNRRKLLVLSFSFYAMENIVGHPFNSTRSEILLFGTCIDGGKNFNETTCIFTVLER